MSGSHKGAILAIAAAQGEADRVDRLAHKRLRLPMPLPEAKIVDSPNSNSPTCPMCSEGDPRILVRKEFADRAYNLACCKRCGLHFCLPPPSEAQIKEFYAGDYHSNLRMAGATEKAFGRKFASYRDWLLRFLTEGRTLDIGTGTGLFPSLLKQAGFDAEGLEYNQLSAQWGEAHYGVKIRAERLEQSGAVRGAYDLISMTDVLEHTENPLRYLRTVREYLKPDGFMLVTFPDIKSLESRYLRFWSQVFRRGWIWSNCHIPLHVWEFTPATAEAMFQMAGFDILGFRRSQVPPETSASVIGLLTLPLQIFRIPAIGRRIGTQMEFIIRNKT